ncbi:MAG: metalloregulator ArsR/SmtB family transcription factor [Planctomycetota bacterium]|nr:metalloregulator ArsR/SmtB family transcription factor [Planctomycetota bacterium]
MDRQPQALPGACADSLQRHMRPELFRALCDPTRLAVVGRLATASRPLTVTEVSGCCGVHLSGVSRHLALLREAGVVCAEKQGREVRYALDCAGLTQVLRGLADAIDDCRAACCAAPTESEESKG